MDSAKQLNVILSELARARQWWLVDPVFDEMDKQGIEPDRFDLNKAIAIFAKCQLLVKAEQ